MIVRTYSGESASSRESSSESTQITESLDQHPWVAQILDNLTEMTLVLDQRRRIIFANRPLLAKLGIDDATRELYGRRIGDCLGCVHASTGNGCGTTDACNTCGGNLAIRAAFAGKKDRRECRVRRRNGDEAFDFLVTTTPMKLVASEVVFCSLTDISAEKRRDLLEQTFFHDVLNTAGVVSGYTRLLTVVDAERAKPFAAKTYAATATLIDEITSQRDLRSAENGDLCVSLTDLDSLELLRSLVDRWSQHEVARERTLVVAPEAQRLQFRSDRILLGRVLSNMIKNALEAAPQGSTVTVSCTARETSLSFAVNNRNEMPRDAQLQVFQRSFSTKGKGRGIGTYSMKLLTEHYLGGTVGFTTSKDRGTTFTVTLRRFPAPLEAVPSPQNR